MATGIMEEKIADGKVSVILLTVNRFEYLDEAINSLEAQTFFNWELLIIQDGYNQKVTDKIHSYLAKDSRISFYQRPELNSIGSSINFAIQRAKGSYIAILDDDDIWFDTEKLQKQVFLLDKEPGLSLVASWAYGIDKNGARISEIKKTNNLEFIKKTCLISNPVIHSSAVYRRDIALHVGLYDEGIPDYQDWDFVLKILTTGKIEIIPQFMISYRMWEGNATSTKVASMLKSLGIIIQKHKKNFPRASVASVYHFFFKIYSKLPHGVQKITTKYISAIKKSILNLFHKK